MNLFLFTQILVASFNFFSSCKTEKEFGDIGCRAGSYKFNDFCYSMNSMLGNYNDAIKFCEFQGGKLMSVKNELDYLIIQRFLIRTRLRKFWIGLNDKKEEGVWVFGDETPIGSFTAWLPNEPNDKMKNQDCGYVWDRVDFKWKDDFCHSKKFFICQFNLSVADCDSRAGSPFNGDCFKIIYQLANYDDAHATCRAMEGHLANIKTKEIFEFIKKLIYTDKSWKSLSSKETLSIIYPESNRLPSIWAGIKLINESWTYNDGSVVKYHTNWAIGEPNNFSPGEECVIVRTKWHDINCKDKIPFICKCNAFEDLQASQRERASDAGWSKSQLFGLVIAGFLIGLLAPVIYFFFVKFYP